MHFVVKIGKFGVQIFSWVCSMYFFYETLLAGTIILIDLWRQYFVSKKNKLYGKIVDIKHDIIKMVKSSTLKNLTTIVFS